MNKKTVIIDKRAKKDFVDFSQEVQEEFLALIRKLEQDGRLEIPEGKKISGYNNLYEIRVRLKGQWRGFYAYLEDDFIVVLHFINKKSQKTPLKELGTASNRLKDYLS